MNQGRYDKGAPPRLLEVLRYWFGHRPTEGGDDAEVAQTQAAIWWSHDPEVDRLIEERFGALLAATRSGAPGSIWSTTPLGLLAVVVVLDQFSRNVCRGTPDAFAQDPLARDMALGAITEGVDQQLTPIERLFLYLPLEHSENLADQEHSVALCRQLAASLPGAQQEPFLGFVTYAESHRDVIAQFGRFPHRNEILGRESTREELLYLSQPGAGF